MHDLENKSHTNANTYNLNLNAIKKVPILIYYLSINRAVFLERVSHSVSQDATNRAKKINSVPASNLMQLIGILGFKSA